MNPFFIGLITSIAIIAIVEAFGFLEKRLIAAMTLVGIPFIYIGFAWHDLPSLILCIIGVAVFVSLAYFGYKKNFMLIVMGLILHGIWDVLYPLAGSSAPDGYDVFCITIDVLLAIYFYLRVKPATPHRPDAIELKENP